MNTPPQLTTDQLVEVKAICDEICEWLDKNDEYAYDLNERRGKAGSFEDEVWDEAMRILRTLRWDAYRRGGMIRVRRA